MEPRRIGIGLVVLAALGGVGWWWSAEEVVDPIADTSESSRPQFLPTEHELIALRTEVVDVVMVDVVPPTEVPDNPHGPATAGHVTVVFETFLADLQGVVPRVAGVPTTQGLAYALPSPDPPWNVSLSLDMTGWDFELTATLCDAAGECTEHVAGGSRLNPNEAVATIVLDISDRLGRRPHVPFDVWAKAETEDSYALKLMSTAAGILQGYIPPVEKSKRWNSRADPVARSVFVDASMATGWVIYGRVSDDPMKWLKAYTYASEKRPESVALRAARAASMESAGYGTLAKEAWREILDDAPGDLRFLIPRARAALSGGSPEDARAVLAELGGRFAEHHEVVRLRVDIAEAEGNVTDDVLVTWQNADASNPEPVRRRVLAWVRDGEWDKAMDLAPVLASRGEKEEAASYRVALGTALERYEEAAQAARSVGNDDLARRILARGRSTGADDRVAVLEGAVEPRTRLALAAALVEAGRSKDALLELEVVTDHDPWWPVALHLQARALENLGRDGEALDVRDRLRHVDPLFQERSQ